MVLALGILCPRFDLMMVSTLPTSISLGLEDAACNMAQSALRNGALPKPQTSSPSLNNRASVRSPFTLYAMNTFDGSVAYDSQLYTLAAYNVWVTRICQLCPCIIFFYDYLLTLDREVEYIWKRPVTSSNILYITVRYGGGLLVVLTTMAFTSEHTSQKVHSFYHFRDGPVSAFSGQFSSYCSSEYTNEPLPGIRICAVMRAPPALAYIWLPDIIFGAFLFVLAARVGFKRGRFGSNIFRMERKDLVDALLHGNLHYFFCILAVNVVNAGVWKWLGYTWFEAPEGFAAVIEIILGCRMVLDLRSTVSRPEGLHLSDSFRLKPSFGAREGPSTYYSVVSTCELDTSHQLIGSIELTSPSATSGGVLVE
ncbi:hypothetical protein K503DRAFT_797087 [Rhizopogon vinicolor AM-OR11-026]|uniref:DUF6533 domain-containing protein n=1 Tax=Rhizopogon vinicolor AM-OR11-026 TaxID=1314800 RepID=A0A1B7NCF3_9AGAM|nr:hypothetical protein K503DRAFT_797087 [Rhizopogon vinicolor AM-OR11-026]